jgi:hypothetical protein
MKIKLLITRSARSNKAARAISARKQKIILQKIAWLYVINNTITKILAMQ